MPREEFIWMDLDILKFGWGRSEGDNTLHLCPIYNNYHHSAVQCFSGCLCCCHHRMRILCFIPANSAFDDKYSLCEECLKVFKNLLLSLHNARIDKIIDKISIDIDFFDDIDTSKLVNKNSKYQLKLNSKICPNCGSMMAVRTARAGGENKHFWGCSTYPNCSYSEDYTEQDLDNILKAKKESILCVKSDFLEID